MKGPVNTNYKAYVLKKRHEQKLIEKLSKRMHVKLKKSKSYEKLTSFVLRRSSSLRTNIGRSFVDFLHQILELVQRKNHTLGSTAFTKQN